MVFDFIVNDMIDDVLVLQTEFEATTWAGLLRLNLNIASFLKRATLNIAEVSLICLGGDLNIFISIRKLELD